MRHGLQQEALKHLEEAVSLHRDGGENGSMLAYALLRVGRRDQAASVLEATLQEYPDSVPALRLAGVFWAASRGSPHRQGPLCVPKARFASENCRAADFGWRVPHQRSCTQSHGQGGEAQAGLRVWVQLPRMPSGLQPSVLRLRRHVWHRRRSAVFEAASTEHQRQLPR